MTNAEAIETLRANYPDACFEQLREAVDKAIKALEEPKRKTGMWKTTYLDHEAFGERPRIFYCSVCNQCIAYLVNFCPSCGADMRGEKI